ncbi:MAG: putative rane protein [Anaerocolumna sp.]|jgi:hypothetical protein|nr:putative rane protein [Anaerocolumna sp.]
MKKLLSLLLIFTLCFTVVPNTASAAVTISKSKATMEVDSTLKLKISGTKSKISWKTSKKAVATVTGTGTVTAKSEGQATITATVGSNKYTCAVTVVDSNKPVANKTYAIGETWTVDGLWSLTFDSVTVTDDRNPYSDKNPDQVVILNYTYENIGYKGSFMDLYISSSNMNIIDEKGEVASTYPADTSVYPKETPVGAKCVGAQEAYGLNNESSIIKVYVEMYDANYNTYEAVFELKVE